MREYEGYMQVTGFVLVAAIADSAAEFKTDSENRQQGGGCRIESAEVNGWEDEPIMISRTCDECGAELPLIESGEDICPDCVKKGGEG